jgi:oligopeptidase B
MATAKIPTSQTSNFSLLKRGVILATAHVRGGGELGKWWYDNGKLLNKMNSFSDFHHRLYGLPDLV